MTTFVWILKAFLVMTLITSAVSAFGTAFGVPHGDQVAAGTFLLTGGLFLYRAWFWGR
ncbi:MAG TPA: hypothetical protein VGF29_04555 [Hyphomicrobiaceae bacterium]|jgi:hypothetical protein